MKIAVDFDGTIVEDKFPAIGQAVPGAFYWLHTLQQAGAKLILWTMRSEDYLDAAVRHCREHGVLFDSVNEGIDDRDWTSSPKAYAHVYIDDEAFGCPLIDSKEMGARPMVNWDVIGPDLLRRIEKVSSNTLAEHGVIRS